MVHISLGCIRLNCNIKYTWLVPKYGSSGAKAGAMGVRSHLESKDKNLGTVSRYIRDAQVFTDSHIQQFFQKRTRRRFDPP